jgi:hypothetical protein
MRNIGPPMSVRGHNPKSPNLGLCQLWLAADIRPIRQASSGLLPGGDPEGAIGWVRLPSNSLRESRHARSAAQRQHQKWASPFDHLVGALLKRSYLKLIKSVRLSVEALGFKGSFVAFALF